MSKFTRVILIGATVAAMNLAGTIGVAHAGDAPTSNQDRPRPPTELQVGEAWRHPRVAPTTAESILKPPPPAKVGEPWRQRASVPAQPAERPPADSTTLPGWLVVSLGLLVPALALAVLATRRTSRDVRVGPAA